MGCVLEMHPAPAVGPVHTTLAGCPLPGFRRNEYTLFFSFICARVRSFDRHHAVWIEIVLATPNSTPAQPKRSKVARENPFFRSFSLLHTRSKFQPGHIFFFAKVVFFFARTLSGKYCQLPDSRAPRCVRAWVEQPPVVVGAPLTIPRSPIGRIARPRSPTDFA